jgi:soluble P-type ATPase
VFELSIPGFGDLHLDTLICDFNGTLARDGHLIEEARTLLPRIASLVDIRVVTGNTFGSATDALRDCPCTLTLLDAYDQAKAKLALVETIGASRIVAIGNGRNDRLMLKAAALGIGVVGGEGIAGEAASASDVIASNIAEALELLLEPRRLLATLRD